MRPVSTILAVLLFAAWIAITIVSVDAIRLMGAQLAIDVFFGGMFNLMFVLVALVLAKGDIRKLLLGARA